MELSKILKLSIDTLTNDSYDVVHDFYHHYAVLENVYNIINAENLSVDMEKLSIATLFHDYETYYTQDERHKKLRKLLSKTNSIDLEKIIKIIDEHSLSAHQTLTESKVLFDADKLEGISILRWEYAMNSYKDGLISEDRLNKYFELLNDNYIENVESRLFYNFSKQTFENKKQLFISWAKKNNILVNDQYTISSRS